MSGADTDKRQQETPPERPNTTNLPPSVDLEAYNIDVSEPFGYGTGNDDRSRVDRTFNEEGLASSTNPVGPGLGDQRVKDLQTLMIKELDPEGRQDQPSTVLPQYGVDGIWRCETQEAFNRLLEKKGVPCNAGEETVAGCDGSQIPACFLDEEMLENLKQAATDEQEEEQEEVSEDAEKEVKDRPLYDDQCFLIQNIKKVIEESIAPEPVPSFHEERTGRKRTDIKYKNIHKLATTDPGTIMNRLRLTKGCTEFLDIRHYQLSQLTPSVRIYKQYYEGSSKTPREVEMQFSTYVDPVLDLQSMLNSQLQRGVGIGIESFTFNFKGVQPATAKKDIEAKLVVYAQNFNELFKTRPGIDQNGRSLEGGYRIIDLVLLEPKYRNVLEENTNKKIREFNPNFYEIKVRAGWGATGGGGLLSDDLSAAIKDNQVEMFLVVTKHEFQFQDDGSVRLVLDFRARIESVLLDKRSDVLFSEEVIARREERAKKINEISTARIALNQSKENSDCTDDSIKELRKIYEQTVEVEREQAYLSLLKELTSNNCIYTANINSSEAVTETSDTDRVSDPEIKFNIVNYGCEDTAPLEYVNILEPGVRKINYFFLGDLYAAAVNNVLEKTTNSSSDVRRINFGNIKFVLGPAPFDNPSLREDGQIMLNIADIPVSVELFTDFMREKIIKGRKNTYPLLLFMRDVMKDLVFEALGPECNSGDNRINLLLDSAQISADSASGGGDPIAEKIGDGVFLDLDEYGKNLPIPKHDSNGIFGRKNKKNNGTTKFVFDSFNRKSLDRSYEFFVIYAYGKEPRRLAFEKSSEFSSRYERDLSNGIFHATTALDRGLVKSMEFSATNQPFLREARYEQSDFKPELQLSNVYRSTVTMYGNNLFYPGCQLFINPRGLGSDLLGDPGVKDSNANIMGLGGYHVVISVNHSISQSGYTTTLECLFTTSGDGLASIMSPQSRVGDTLIVTCADLEKEIENLANSMNGQGGGS